MTSATTQAEDAATGALTTHMRANLITLAARAQSITYAMLADALDVQPPNRIHQVTQTLEALMAEDAANGHPFIAALVISARRRGLPASGFFETAYALGPFDGSANGPEAIAFHHRAFADAVAFWGAPQEPGTQLDRTSPAGGE